MASDKQTEIQAPDATPPGGFKDAANPSIADQGPDPIGINGALPGSPSLTPQKSGWTEREELREDVGSNVGATPEIPNVQRATGRGASARRQAAAQAEDLTGARRQQANPIDQSTKGEGTTLSPAGEPIREPSASDNPAL